MSTCTYTVGRLTFQFDFTDAKDLFAQRVMVELHDEEKCGLCSGTRIHCDIHKVDDFTYFRMKCQNRVCNARLDIGQRKDGIGLFVRRDKSPLTNGWYVYDGNVDNDRDEQTQAAPVTPTPRTTKTPGKTTQAPAAPTATPTFPPPVDNGHAHKQALAGIRLAHTSDELARWWKHAVTLPATETQHRDLEHAHDEAMGRISQSEAPTVTRRPARVVA